MDKTPDNFKMAVWLLGLHDAREMGAVTGGPELTEKGIEELSEVVAFGIDHDWQVPTSRDIVEINAAFVAEGHETVGTTENTRPYAAYLKKKAAELPTNDEATHG